MVIITVDGAYVGYDGTSDVEIVSDTNGVDAAWKEVAAGGAVAPTGTIYGSLYGPLGGVTG